MSEPLSSQNELYNAEFELGKYDYRCVYGCNKTNNELYCDGSQNK